MRSRTVVCTKFAVWVIALVSMGSCGRDVGVSQLNVAEGERSPTLHIMPAERAAMYKALLPEVADPELAAILQSNATMWYDAQSIVPGYQDSMGNPEGMRPNSIDRRFIDTAVPGGHADLFAEKGRFHFPFGTGGLDDSNNAHKINFWSAPRHAGKPLPVAYWRLNWSRWRWMFPKGTVLGEVLFVKQSDDSLVVFEIRTRTRTLTGWEVDIVRPFGNSQSLANAIKAARPDWTEHTNLHRVVTHLEADSNLSPYRLATTNFPGTFETIDGYQDMIPDFADRTLVKELLTSTPFSSVKGKTWKSSGEAVTYAPGTQFGDSIVPRNYQAGVFPVTDEFCQRCHTNAGRQISHFYDDLVLYGELWGEDETFSWHPFQTNMFVNSAGEVVNFNDDNRRIRSDFVNAGLVERYDPAVHKAEFYQELPRSWTYTPYKN